MAPSQTRIEASVEGWTAFYEQTRFAYGYVNAYYLGSHSLPEMVTGYVLAAARCQTQGGRAVFPRLRVVVAGALEAEAKALEDRLPELLRSALEKYLPGRGVSQLVAAFASRTGIIDLGSGETEQLVEALRKLPPHTAVLVLGGEHLFSLQAQRPERTVSAQGRTPFGETFSLNVDEDLWAPQLRHAMDQLCLVADACQLFICLWSGLARPMRPENVALLEGNERCDICWSEQKGIDMEVLDRALTLSSQGRLEEALRLCDKLDTAPLLRALKKATCTRLAGQSPMAYRWLEPFRQELLASRECHNLVGAAEHAVLAGRPGDATDFLRAALLLGIQHEQLLVQAMRVAEHVADAAILAEVRERLYRLYPHQPHLLVRDATRHLQARRYEEILQLLSPVVQTAHCTPELKFCWLAARHCLQGALEPARLLAEIREGVPETLGLAAHFCAVELVERGLPEQAIEWVLSHAWSQEEEGDALGVLLNAVEKLLLARREKLRELPLPLLLASMERAVKYLGQHPGDARRRRKLTQLLAPELSGALLLSCVGALARQPADAWWKRMNPQQKILAEPMPDEHVPAVLEAVFKRMPPQEPRVLIVGVGEAPPAEELPSPPERILSYCVMSIQRAAGSAQMAEQGSQALHIALHLGLLFARVAGVPNEDLSLRQGTAAALCMAGDFRGARDLAESTLLGMTPADSGLRRRLAWLGFADFGLRSHNMPEALLALACASQCTFEERPFDTDVLYELRIWLRVLRDLGSHEEALSLVRMLRKLLRRYELEAGNSHQADYLEASVRLSCWLKLTPGPARQEEFQQLCTLLTGAIRRARTTDLDVQPGMLMLAQLISLGEKFGLDVPEEVRRDFQEHLPRVGDLLAPLMRGMAGQVPPEPLLAQSGWGLDKVRDAGELGNAVHLLEVLARSRLTAAVEAGDAAQALYLMEWSMDRSLRNLDEALRTEDGALLPMGRVYEWLCRFVNHPDSGRDVPPEVLQLAGELHMRLSTSPGGQSSRRPPSSLECAQLMEELSQHGLSVHVLGLDEQRALVHVSVDEGAVRVTHEPREVFDARAFDLWQREYPAGYARMDTRSANGFLEVEQTLEHLGVQVENPNRPLVLISTAELQPLPANLVRINGELAGARTAVASVPSLTWLRAAWATPHPSRGGRCAWIPAGPAGDEQKTLSVLRSLVEEVLEEHGFALSFDDTPPGSLAGADIAFVGAHGDIGLDGAYFRVLSDEHEGRFSPRNLATSVAGARVVILAVCNGGRMDLAPFGRATIGLGRTLLDHGCRAVIASPWALDIGVVRRWLPAFLKSFDAGATVLEAHHTANQAVMRFNSHPAFALSMHLMGDPLTRRLSH